MPPVRDELDEDARSGDRDPRPSDAAALRIGAGVMTLAAAALAGYGVLFLVRNFSDSFLELGIGPGEVDVGKDYVATVVFVAGAVVALIGLRGRRATG